MRSILLYKNHAIFSNGEKAALTHCGTAVQKSDTYWGSPITVTCEECREPSKLGQQSLSETLTVKRKEYQKEYRRTHKESQREYQKEYHRAAKQRSMP